jgi:hypothetical protein
VLVQYQNLTAQLLQNPPAPTTLYTTANLTNYINIARGQIAGEGKCVRAIGTVAAVIGQRAYNFSTINFGAVTTTGIQGAISVRRIMYNVPGATGQKWIKGKSWEWFDFQRFNNPVPPSGAPTEWAQFSQGSSGQGSITGVGGGTMSSGSFYVDPLPDFTYTLNCDCECYPQALAADIDVEALPYLWTDAVPYFAAYMALMTAQTSARLQQAQQLFQLYRLFMQRARAFANPDVTTDNFEQAPDMMTPGRLGVTASGAGGGAQ